MDFLVQPERLLVKGLLIGLMACSQPPAPPENIETMVTYFPGTTDTLEVRSYIQGTEHGRWLKFYSRGQLMEERFFDHGKKVDTLRIWWPNGVLQAQIPFNNDEYEGETVEWNQAGQMIRRMHHQQGHEEGAQQQWYDDGSVRSNYVIKNGRRYGLLGTKNCVNVADSLVK